MQNKTFHYETHDLINAFITAFDDIVISRYNKNREEKETIKVRYVYAPKERVMFDIVNKAQNITLPAVAISVNSLTRDESRVFNKIYGFDAAQIVHANENDVLVRRHIGMPVPVNIEISMSIIANYQLDIDQIVSNFVPYNNPYVILSWKIPTGFKLSNIQELRSEVLWGGSINYNQPVDTTGTDKFRFTADTSFTIKGWLFPSAPHDPLKNIYFINNNFYVARMLDQTKFTGFVRGRDLETISVSASPTITNIIRNSHNVSRHIFDRVGTYKEQENVITLLGTRFDYTTQVWLSSNNTAIGSLTSQSLSFEYFDEIFGYPLPLSSYTIENPNKLIITLPYIPDVVRFDIVVVDSVGWASTASTGVRIESNINYNELYYDAFIASSWDTISNWYLDPTKSIPLLRLPANTSNVHILGQSTLSANIDMAYWVQPLTIDTQAASIAFYSENYGNITISITGTAIFNGNVTYNM